MKKPFVDYSFYKHYKLKFTAKPRLGLQRALCRIDLHGSMDKETWVYIRTKYYRATDTSIGRMYFYMFSKAYKLLMTQKIRINAESIIVECSGISGYLWLSRILPNYNARMVVIYSQGLTVLRSLTERIEFSYSEPVEYSWSNSFKKFENNPSFYDSGILVNEYLKEQTKLRKEAKLWH